LDDKHGLIPALVGACHSLYDDTDFVSSHSRSENREMALEALELARQVGWPSLEGFAEWGLALGLAHWGMFAEALSHANATLRIATEIHHPQRIIGAHYALGYIYILMLQADLAIQNLESGFNLAKEHGSAWLIGNTTVDLACAYLLKNDTGRARPLLEAALQKETGHYTRAERRMLWAKGNLLLAEDKPAEALQIAEHLLDSKQNSQHAQPIPALLKLKGEALSALKQFKQAEQALEEAKTGAEQRDALPLLWQIHRGLGWLYKAQKNIEKSEREFAGARLVIHKLGENISDQALRTRFIQSAGETLPQERKLTRRQNEAEQFGGLTPREREVARLLSQGRSNREIAEALVLSERTVENHIGNILTKLGFTSRAQIAVWTVEKGLVPSGKN
jgi:DNA-binding CsgD family transcriptional regulator